MSEIVDKFLKHCTASTLEEWEFWKKEHNLSDKLIVAGPSRIIALLDIPKLDGEIEWTPYTPISKPTKKMGGCFTYGKHIYSIYFLRDDVYEFIGESVEIGTYAESIMVFKLTETIATSLSVKRNRSGIPSKRRLRRTSFLNFLISISRILMSCDNSCSSLSISEVCSGMICKV